MMPRDPARGAASEPPYFLPPFAMRIRGSSDSVSPADPPGLSGDERPGQAPDTTQSPPDMFPTMTVTARRVTVELLMDLHSRTADALCRIDQELSSLE